MKIYIKFSQLSNEEFSKHDQRFKKKTQRRNKAFLWQPQTHKHANTCPQSNLKTPKNLIDKILACVNILHLKTTKNTPS